MKKNFILAMVLCCALFGCAQETGSKIDTLVNAYARLYRFSGSVLVAKNGTILLNKGYGYRNVTGKVLNNEHSVFQLGSITKQFTSAVILKLAEEKKLNISDKISKYFPGYPKGDSITMEHLLTHTSGIYNYTNDQKFMASEVSIPSNRQKIMALFKDKPLDFSPGTKWNYSNSGYSLLGYIIEDVTKKPYEQVVREYIFTPLQMTHSGFDFTHLKNNEKAIGYFTQNEKKSSPAPIVDSSVSFSAGAIYSTTGDLYLWHKALQNNAVLTKAQQEKAYTPVKNNYGYGWETDSLAGKRRVGHSGGIHGFTTNISRIPEDDVCIILLSNASDGSLNEITNSIFAILYNSEYKLPQKRPTIKLPGETLKRYEGEYEINPGLHVMMSVKDGELVALPTGQEENILYAEKEDFFFVKEDLQLEFTRNAKKEVDGFIMHQGERRTICKKIK